VVEKAQFGRDAEDYRSLKALEEIEKNPNVSQRELAASMGVAVGIANSLVHALVRKGLVKIRGENNRSITYHLTKQGLSQKASLAAQWTMNTIGFYREVRGIVAGGLAVVAASGAKRIVVLGANEIAELAVLVSRDAGLEVVGVIAQAGSYATDTLVGVPVTGAARIAELTPDALLLCLEPQDPQRAMLLDDLPATSAHIPVYWIDGTSVPSGTDAVSAKEA